METETEKRAERPVIPEITPENEARDIMFAHDPNCGQCSKPIEKIEDSTALLVMGKEWRLVHTKMCLADAVFVPWRTGKVKPGYSRGEYLRRFG